jgi:hypothetical protein
MTGSSNRLTGGCQCGALRYEWLEKPTDSSVCYCRMCQKASGQPFMGLTGGERKNLRWTRGTLCFYPGHPSAPGITPALGCRAHGANRVRAAGATARSGIAYRASAGSTETARDNRVPV